MTHNWLDLNDDFHSGLNVSQCHKLHSPGRWYSTDIWSLLCKFIHLGVCLFLCWLLSFIRLFLCLFIHSFVHSFRNIIIVISLAKYISSSNASWPLNYQPRVYNNLIFCSVSYVNVYCVYHSDRPLKVQIFICVLPYPFPSGPMRNHMLGRMLVQDRPTRSPCTMSKTNINNYHCKLLLQHQHPKNQSCNLFLP